MVEYQPPGLLELQEITAKDLEKLDIPESHAELLCGICDDTESMAFIEIYPEEIGEVLIDLATGSLDVTSAYAKLHEEETQAVETIDHPQARRRFAPLVPGAIPSALIEETLKPGSFYSTRIKGQWWKKRRAVLSL